MLVRDQLVCFDDLERRGDGLRPKDVLGLISFLREQRNCKVVLILNDEAMDDAARAEFETHLEKVVDVSLVYEPSPATATSIGVEGKDEAERLIAERCAALGISEFFFPKTSNLLRKQSTRKTRRRSGMVEIPEFLRGWA